MPQFKNDPFPGTDYSKYLSWKKVTGPNGEVVYEVPGHPAYVYDPVASNASGRKVFRANPSKAIEAQEEVNEQKAKAQKQQDFLTGPVGQILPVAAGTAGIIAANQFKPVVADPVAEATAELIKSRLGTGTAAQVAPTTISEAAATGASQTGGTITGAAGGGGADVATTGATGLGEAAAAGNTGVAPTGLSVGGALSNFGAMGVGPQAGIIAGTALTAKGIKDLLEGKKGDPLSRTVTGMSTFGFSELARLAGLGGRKTTKEIQNDRHKALTEAAVTGYQTAGDGLNAEGKLVEGQAADFVGQTADGYVNNAFAGSRDESFLGVEDTIGGDQNFEVVGNDYMGKWGEKERRRYNQLNLEAGNINEKSGGLYYKDKAKAQAFKDQVDKEAGFAVTVPTDPAATTAEVTTKPSPTAANPQVAAQAPINTDLAAVQARNDEILRRRKAEAAARGR